MIFSIAALSLVLAAATSRSNAESHTVVLENYCGQGTPTLVQGNTILSTGGNFVSNGPLVEAIAYLQTGSCGFNGEGCSVVKTTLMNPTSSGSSYSSSTNLTINPPYDFSVPTGFGYFDGCDGSGAFCGSILCTLPFGVNSPDGFFPAICNANNVNLAVIFCEN